MTSVKKQVAVKIIDKAKINKKPVYKHLLYGELEALENLCSPGIAAIYELLEDDDNIYIVMELMQ